MRVRGLKRWLEPDHYGWVIVATLSVTETVTWGIVYYGFPVFLRPMEQDLGARKPACGSREPSPTDGLEEV